MSTPLDPYYRKHLTEWLESPWCSHGHLERGLTDQEMGDKMWAHLESLDEPARENMLNLGWPDIYISTLRTLT